MELDRTVIVGVGGVLVGFVLAYAVGSWSRSALEAQLRQQGDVAASVAASVAELEERLTALDGKLDEGFGSVSERLEAAAAGPGADLQALAERVEGLGGDLGQRLDALAPSVRETLAQDFEGVRDRLSALAERGEAAAGDALDAAAGLGAGSELRVGQTAIFADGAVRVFLSAVDEAGGAARLSVNGARPVAFAVGAAQDLGPCSVTVTGVGGGVATVDGAC